MLLLSNLTYRWLSVGKAVRTEKSISSLVKLKTKSFSEYCGDFACNACMHKTRAFTQDLRSNLGVLAVKDSEIPVATRADIGSSQDLLGVRRGRICVICDRKFMLYDYYADFAC